jgi:hypothetical protein
VDGDRFSVNQQLEANDYNQGCFGGDPMLSARIGQEFPVVTETCWETLRDEKDDKKRLELQQTAEECKDQMMITNFG